MIDSRHKIRGFKDGYEKEIKFELTKCGPSGRALGVFHLS